jgi:hypothetical protein
MIKYMGIIRRTWGNIWVENIPIIKAFFPFMSKRLKAYAPITEQKSESKVTAEAILKEFRKYLGKSVTERIVA